MVRRWAGLAMAAAALAVTLPVAAADAASAAGSAGGSDPAQNIAPSPSYWSLCVQQGQSSQQCTDTIVQAIDNARSLEGVGPMTLPAGFTSLTPAQQTFVVSNLERVDRGLPPVAGMVDALNSLATDAADDDADPMLSSWTVGPFQVSGWSSIWAGDLNALAADYDWMYSDGWSPQGSYNLDCQSATASGCWGHRNAILRSGSHLITGVGSQSQSRWMSIAQILVSGAGSDPAFTYSWADVTGDASTPPADTGDVVGVQPMVTLHTWATSKTRRTVVASVTPALGQSVRLRRLTITGWHTVRRTTAVATVIFDSVRRGAYRLVVNPASGSLRTVTRFRLS
jgi:hypothetical protein